MKKQLFFSHTWRLDKLKRDNHDRVKNLVLLIQSFGWTTWFDEFDMGFNIDNSMAEGIDNCECVIICLTDSYCNKINKTSKNLNMRDNCLKEWTYTHCKKKLIIPLVMEPYLLNVDNWESIICLYLGNLLYIDLSNDYLFHNAANKINDRLYEFNLKPINKISNDFKYFSDLKIDDKKKYKNLKNYQSDSKYFKSYFYNTNRKNFFKLNFNDITIEQLSP